MTEPDEALLWAREDLAKKFERYKPYISETIRNGAWDNDVGMRASVIGYRAGAAASADRIKALEAGMAELRRTLINTAANLRGATSLLENGGKKAAPSNKMFEIMLSDYRAASGRAYHAAERAAALLKEPDQ